jgi:hypothetical protein
MGMGRFRSDRVATLVAAVCVTAVTLAGCGQPEFTYVKNSEQHVYFKVPFNWHEVDQHEVENYFLGEDPESELGQRIGQMRPWSVAYDEADPPMPMHFSFASEQPFVYARVEYLTVTGRDQVSLDVLRDTIFVVSETSRQNLAQKLSDAEKAGQPLFYPFQDFEPVDDVVLNPGHGLRGVRSIFNYRYASQDPPQKTEEFTFDQTALLSEDSTRIYLLIITCSATCYRERHAELDAIATSFTVRSP